VLVGFLLVGVSNIPLVGPDYFQAASQNFYWVATGVGFVLLGVGSWMWLLTLSHRIEGQSELSRVLLVFAVASLVLGIANLGLINEAVDVYRRGFHAVRHLLLSESLSVFGFAVVALGFWSAARSLRAQLRRA